MTKAKQDASIEGAVSIDPVTGKAEVRGKVTGIQAILNFSPVVLEVPKHVVVNNVDLAVELENLSYFIR